MRERAAQRRVLRGFFWLGFSASGVAGGLALLVLALVQPAITRSLQERTEVAGASGLKPELSSAVLDLPVWRHERANAPFFLRIAGVAAQSGLSVRLRHMPETAWLSRGEREDEHTWALLPSDLEGLRLTLGEGTPDMFDIGVEVVSAAGVTATQTIAHVRVLEEPARMAAAVGGVPKPTTPMTPAPASMALRATAAPVHPLPNTKRSAPRSLAARPEAVAVPAAPHPAARPEGLSALGGPARASDDRQVWWQVPMPTWSSLTGAASGN
jgi:hypothetical protein